MTFWIILVMALLLSLISFKYRSLLFSLAGSILWVALWAYNNNYPPTNIAQGSFVHEILMYGSIIMAIGVMFMYFMNRKRGYTGYTQTDEEKQTALDSRPRRGIMDLDTSEYRTYMRAKMRGRRR
jgi:hypothetical protein